MDLESAVPQQTSPVAINTPQPPKKPGGVKIVLIILSFVVVLLVTAITAEAIYLSKNPAQKCSLLGCQEFQALGMGDTAPKPLNADRITALRKFLDKLTPDKQDGAFYRELKYTLITQGLAAIAIPEIVEIDGVKYVYHLGLQDEKGAILRYRFTQAELDIMDVKIVTWGGETKDATIKDLQEGDYVVIKTTGNLLDTYAGDTINLEIKRERF